MTHTRTTWVRVSKRHPCPVCQRATYCTVAADGTAAICPRTPSALGWKGKDGGGYLHRLDGSPLPAGRVDLARREQAAPGLSHPELQLLARQYRTAMSPERMARLAASLGVSEQSLSALGAGWSADHGAYTFPMHGPMLRGFRLRFPDGRKLSVKGGKEALFIPVGAGPRSPLLACEGPTSCAALLDLGFNAIARPSCSGGVGQVANYLAYWRQVGRKAHPPLDVVVVGDHDAAKTRPDGSRFYPGQEGAERLADVLLERRVCRTVKVLVPPNHKDARDWKSAGGTKAVIDAVIKALPYWRGGRSAA